MRQFSLLAPAFLRKAELSFSRKGASRRVKPAVVTRLSEPCNKFKTRLICQPSRELDTRDIPAHGARGGTACIQSSRAECCEPLDPNARGFKARIRVRLIDDAPPQRPAYVTVKASPSSPSFHRLSSERARAGFAKSRILIADHYVPPLHIADYPAITATRSISRAREKSAAGLS